MLKQELKLDSNECMRPFQSPNLSFDLVSLAQINRYRSPCELEKKLAERHRVPTSQIVVTAGADEALTRMAHTFLNESSHIVTTVPTFPMILHHSRQATRKVTTCVWMGLHPFPTEKVIEEIYSETQVVALASPNNPTGSVVDFEDIQRLSKAVPNGIVVVDMVYADFADVDLAHQVRSLNNVITIHSLSKSWGLAGLRIGYAIGPEHLIQRLRTAGSPYPVSSLSLEFVLAHFEQLTSFANTYIAAVKHERSQLFDELLLLGCKPWQSQANFVFCHHPAAQVIYHQLQTLGIVCKFFSEILPNEGDHFRLTCPGNRNDFQTLVGHLRSLPKVSNCLN